MVLPQSWAQFPQERKKGSPAFNGQLREADDRKVHRQRRCHFFRCHGFLIQFGRAMTEVADLRC